MHVVLRRIGRSLRSARERGGFDELAMSRGYIKTDNFHKLARSPATSRRATSEKVAKSHGYVQEIGLAEMMGAQRFSVDEVIDVGVYAGTDWLYDNFSAANFVLVEPIPDGEGLLEHKPTNYTYVNCGLGSEPGRLTLNRYHNQRLNSFLEKHHILEKQPRRRQLADRVEVPVRTLDDVIEEYCTSDNIGIKIDTEDSGSR